ncbi:hypothetical protein HPB50_008234 [Hyalomma asiaticum]|uniref:Uncharacterized protein n=1 Tax=Hyalomma asiaticum TaxID=266040 RepID=A0ACB7SD64_HYAAI|nr:hypothetical protein HPB50_008234 [Hyalomma asiaticum]
MATEQPTPVASSCDQWSNAHGGAENVEPDEPPLAVDSKQLPKRRARRRRLRMRGGSDKPPGRLKRYSEMYGSSRTESDYPHSDRGGSVGATGQLQNERGGAMEAPLFSALFLLTSVLFLASLLSLYYSIAFSHLRRWLRLTEEYDECRTKFCCVFSTRVKSVRNESTNLCEDIYTPMCSTVNLTCPDAEITSKQRTWSVSEALTRRLLGLADVLGSQEALENPASNASALLFRSCLAKRQYVSMQSDIRQLLSSVGLSRWPLRENQTVDVAAALTALLRDFAAPFVVTLSVKESAVGSDTRSLSLDAPELLIGPTWWPLTIATDETVKDVKDDHREVYKRYAMAVLYEVLTGDASTRALSQLATELYVFEQALAAHIPRRSTYADRIELRLPQMQESHDMALWGGILRAVFESVGRSTLELVPVVIFSRYYLAFLNELLWKRSVVLANYLGWRIVEYVAWSCSTTLRYQRHRFRYSVRPFLLTTESPELRCVVEVYQLLPASSSRLYRFAVSLLPKSERVQGMNVSFGHGILPPAERFTSGNPLSETDLYENLLTIARRRAQTLLTTMRGDEPAISRDVNHIGVAPVYDPVKNTLWQYFHEDGFKNYSWWSLFTTTNYEANKQCMEFLMREKSAFSPTEEEMTDLLWSGAALHVAHKNRCTSSLLHAPLTAKAMNERDWVNQVAQQGTNFRKAFRCPGPASCPFWRLEENDCWDESESTSSWRTVAETAGRLAHGRIDTALHYIAVAQ